MKVSLNSIRGLNKRYHSAADFVLDDRELTEKISAQLGAIDEVSKLGEKYRGIIIAKVVACEKHPDADKLSLCKIDDGGAAQGIERDDNGHVQVVCGAPNVREGLTVAWLPPGTTVPETAGKEPFVLEAREIRGQKSNGMLASPKELALGDSQAGILEIDGDHQPGTDFAEAFELQDDVVLDIENKMFTHRPDCFGFLGIARELAGIQQMPFKSPEWYIPAPTFSSVEVDPLQLEVKNELPTEVPRFTALVLRDVTVGPSPVWLQVELAKIGQKSINNIVDYTNFFMQETGQPLHAYDYDKVKKVSGGEGAVIVIRNPKPSEKIKLLNGKEIEPRAEAIMIATDQQLIGVGGVMGGSETEVDETTTNIILECANFDMYSIRRTSMTHGLFTDAVTRFTKGQSPLQNLAVLTRIIVEIRSAAGGKVASELIDINHVPQDDLARGSLHPPVKLSADFINSRLGLELTAVEMKTLLENVEFTVETTNDELMVTAPFWRTDIELREDVVEEIGRLHGYDKLPLTLPKRDLTPTAKDPMLNLKAWVRAALTRGGANEALTYSFVHGDLLDKVGQDKSKAFQVANALSPDLQYYRMSLLPSLLDKVHLNVKAGYDEFVLFELGKAHVHGEPDPFEPSVPKEVNALAAVYASKQAAAGAAYYWARQQLAYLLTEFGSHGYVKFEPLQGADLYKNPWVEQMTAPFEPNRSAVLRDEEGLIWGVVGEFKTSVRRALKLPANAAGFEIDPLLLLSANQNPGYTPLSRFPKVTQDITLKVAAELGYQELFNFIEDKLGQIKPAGAQSMLEPVDIYQKPDDTEHKQITLRLTITSYDRTLTDLEVNKMLDNVAEAAKDKFGAERV